MLKSLNQIAFSNVNYIELLQMKIGLNHGFKFTENKKQLLIFGVLVIYLVLKTLFKRLQILYLIKLVKICGIPAIQKEMNGHLYLNLRIHQQPIYLMMAQVVNLNLIYLKNFNGDYKITLNENYSPHGVICFGYVLEEDRHSVGETPF